MKSRVSRKPSAADYLASPVLSPASPTRSATESPSPVKFDFNLDGFNDASSLKKKKQNSNVKSKSVAGGTSSVPMQPIGSPSAGKNISSISDLKDLAASRLECVKRQLDRSHAEILKDVETFQSRLHKRFKIQTQGSQQVMDEAEKEYKKIIERINEGQDAMKASYAEFMAEAQASASRVCKTTIPELAQSLEKSMDVLRSRYVKASTSG